MSSNPWRYVYPQDTEIVLREVEINTGKNSPDVVIAQITDPHFNWCNEKDLNENDPVVMSTWENRRWLRLHDGGTGRAVRNATACLDYVKDADQIIVTGDALDYLSWGGIEILQKVIWDEYPDAIITLGNHDAVRKMQGTVDDPTTFESRLEILKSVWKHDIFYTSKVMGDKVMIIQLDNGSQGGFGGFWDCQVEPLRNDLNTAREKGYAVLLFYHIPLATQNPDGKPTESSLVGDKGNSVVNFCALGVGSHRDGASGEIYKLITNNGDIIKGAFCGHKHCDFYTEIAAKTADGADTVIPQYILIGSPYGSGHVLRITVK